MNDTTTTTENAQRRPWRIWIAIAATLALVGGALAFGAWFRTTGDASTDSALQARLQGLIDAGYPGALASVTRADGERLDVGVGEVGDTDAAADAQVRIGSNTKMFVATVVLQLVDEGRVSLDAPIDTYLPGLVRGDGIDGTAITVRQLLQHQTGLPEYADELAADAFGMKDVYISPRDMLDLALSSPASFAPGESWEYSNTNYIVLGLLIERVTERALWEQIDERIVEPLDLERTYLPGPGERELRDEHPPHFHADTPGELREITEMDPASGWSAGAMVSTPGELNTFMRALFAGELVSDETLAEMQDGTAAGDDLWPEATYGLGLQSFPLSCGGIAWGHGGDIPGAQTRNAIAPDGTTATIAVTALPWAIVDGGDEELLLEHYRIVVDVLDQTLCDR
ncbi:beta-lactamase family protein [Microbacterium sp. zg.Y625]|uniref:serine hydrolase domain-containing protein n=1 Tax=Microbacterium jiangjiandongii TaxID=3049071 RepID=UPI00214C35AF|nr:MULTISPECIES: serine hydrolase domain-containing protein [unclassified Microbacterium]MCR2792858.1 beta-lactamase family protein [Microbacterium sp. zg.Y625]MCR2814507.1 beta-lactamase family protein [Microbacterium sp. zg.Y843]WIM26830.1 serine hydrolase domain-containing protein [Microbacterium sp. zg-Y625]